MSDEKPQKKMPRDVQLRHEIRALDVSYIKSREELQATTGAAIKKAMTESLRQTNAFHKTRDTAVAGHRDKRDRAKRDAEKAYTEALRRAQGERDKALKQADATFEQERWEIDTEIGKKTLPIREAFEKLQAEIIEKASTAMGALDATFKSEREPRVAELKEVEEKLAAATAAAEERKKVKEAETPEQAAP